MLRYPDPQRSGIVLVGTSDYERSDKLPNLPAIRNNLVGLTEAFTNPVAGVFSPDRCTVVDSPDSPKSLLQRLNRVSGETEDTLIVYYSGHGLLGLGTKLYLAVRETDSNQLAGTAVPFEWVRDAIQNSPAEIRILLLDCCFSGRAIGAMSSDSAALEQVKVTGTSIFTSTTANDISHSIPGERYTAFTGELIRLLTEFRDSPLSLGNLYRPLSAAMVRRGLPAPRSSVGDSSGSLILRKRSPRSHHVEDNHTHDYPSNPVPAPRPSRNLQSIEKTDTFPFRQRVAFNGYQTFGDGDNAVLVEPATARSLRAAASKALPLETGGLLSGRTLRDAGGHYVLVIGFVEARPGSGRTATFKISPQETERLRGESSRADPTADVVGWWHSHPYPSSYSATDLASQSMWTQPHSVGLLVFADGEHWARVYMGPGATSLGYPIAARSPGPARPPGTTGSPGLDQDERSGADAQPDPPVLMIPNPSKQHAWQLTFRQQGPVETATTPMQNAILLFASFWAKSGQRAWREYCGLLRCLSVSSCPVEFLLSA